MDELLFDELLWVEHAQEEHDAFADVLRTNGAEVLHVEDAAGRGAAPTRSWPARSWHSHVSDRACGPSARSAGA